MTVWRVGSKIPINVYDGDRPVCQCQTVLDARNIVRAVNASQERAEQIAEIGTNAAHMSIREFRAWFKRIYGDV
jgi:N-dimethylarginine dimethylaminohydrolase